MARVLSCEAVDFTLLHVGDDLADFPAVTTVEHPGWTWHEVSRKGDVVDVIATATEELDADLVVMVTKGHEGFLDALRGNTTERVLKRVRCPLLAVPDLDIAAP